MKKIAIIGTGLSAIFSAIHLRKNTDLEINLFDKARGLGGRLATRRAEGGKFDHGAQYFSIERINNLPEIQMLINEGVINNIEDKDIYFSPDGMTNIAKKLLTDFNIFKEHKLVSIDKENENCFKINLPYSVEMPDSSIITINNVDDRKKIEDWYENNPKNESRHKLIYPVQLVFESEKEDEEPKIVTVNNSDEMKEIQSECKECEKKGRGKDKKEWCKKLDVSEIDECIKEYVNNNYPDDKIVHSRSILTKEDVTIHVVKLQKAGILKFGEDCEFID